MQYFHVLFIYSAECCEIFIQSRVKIQIKLNNLQDQGYFSRAQIHEQHTLSNKVAELWEWDQGIGHIQMLLRLC